MNDGELKAVLKSRLDTVRERIERAAVAAGRAAGEVRLIAVTKSVSARVAKVVFDLGISDGGESRPQNLWAKAAELPDVRWHLIGHLQRNKIERTLPLCHLVHSVDSERLLKALSGYGVSAGKTVRVLLEFNCSREEAKGGFPPGALAELVDAIAVAPGVSVDGLMTMTAYGATEAIARATFAELRELRDELQHRTGQRHPELSMGMSGDFEAAILEGATMVRIGSTLFEGLQEDSVPRGT